MIRLRPHHLLCTQGYSGNGYDKDFVINMDKILERIKRKDERICLVFSTDDICSCCPNKMGENHCLTNEKVLEIDRKVVEYFSLDEGEYVYGEVTKFIRDNMTLDIMDDICGKCDWYAVSNCRRRVALGNL